jgi:hypothetical protein
MRCLLVTAALAVAAATLRGGGGSEDVAQQVLAAGHGLSVEEASVAVGGVDATVSLKAVVISQNMANTAVDTSNLQDALRGVKVGTTSTTWLAAATGADILIAATQERANGFIDIIDALHTPSSSFASFEAGVTSKMGQKLRVSIRKSSVAASVVDASKVTKNDICEKMWRTK